MDEILQRLTEVSIRQQQITEHLAARQGQTEQGLDELRTAAARRIPLPDPRCKITQLLPKMTADDDVEACGSGRGEGPAGPRPHWKRLAGV